jgi:hypothetical protein
MIKGWLSDHEWRLLTASLAGGLMTLVANPSALDNPLGDSYSGLTPNLLIFLTASAGFVLSLPSKAARVLALPGPRSARAVWFLATGASTGYLGWAARSFELDGWSVLSSVAWTACLPALAGLIAGEGLGLVLIFFLFAACVFTPRDALVPWWNPVLAMADHPAGKGAALALVSALAGLYLWDARGGTSRCRIPEGRHAGPARPR